MSGESFKVAVVDPTIDIDELSEDLSAFCKDFEPLEKNSLVILRDHRTGAVFLECHVSATKLISRGTTDVPLDPDNSPDYRANRDLVADHSAFEQMCEDALEKRRFSDIVAEYNPQAGKPLQVIGGQHRFRAIEQALEEDVETEHGLKVYFQLDKDQRLDVQIISNTNISVSKDLLDRMYETLAGAELRTWCQKCGLLEKGQDFADKTSGSNSMTVKEARTFIANYFLGRSVNGSEFSQIDTTPKIVDSGTREPALWRDTKTANPGMWDDSKLLTAGKRFAEIRKRQIEAFRDPKTGKFKGRADHRNKAKNLALLSGWAFVAGCLEKNASRLKHHYGLKDSTTKDPFRADLLAGGRHSSDPENYRGLGYRSDSKERGRFAELFWLQAEKSGGITKPMVELAIQNYEAKQANLRAKALREKL